MRRKSSHRDNVQQDAILDVTMQPGAWTMTLLHELRRPMFKTTLDFDNVELRVRGEVKEGSDNSDKGFMSSLNADLMLRARYDNIHIAGWEPLIEPWRAHVAFNFCSQRKKFGNVHSSVARTSSAAQRWRWRNNYGTAVEIDLESKHSLNVNISQSLIQTVVSDVLLRKRRTGHTTQNKTKQNKTKQNRSCSPKTPTLRGSAG